ncbi:hypothetical protein Tco_0583756 [Tanacetum coccineum]
MSEIALSVERRYSLGRGRKGQVESGLSRSGPGQGADRGRSAEPRPEPYRKVKLEGLPVTINGICRLEVICILAGQIIGFAAMPDKFMTFD